MKNKLKKLQEFLKDIEYGYMDKSKETKTVIDKSFESTYILQNPKEVYKNKIGTCWDQVELERYILEEQDIQISSFFIVHYDNNKCPTHTFITIADKDKIYWFENSWEAYKGIHEYNNIYELLNDVKDKFIDKELKSNYVSKNLVIYKYEKPQSHINIEEFYKHCESGIKINIPSENLLFHIKTTVNNEYQKNDSGHQLPHINYVVNRAFNISLNIKETLDQEILYTAATYHDIAHHKNKKEHHILSAKYVKNNIFLKNYFNQEELSLIIEVIEDHRASNKETPRNIYGKILSTADRGTDIKTIIKRSYNYAISINKNLTQEEIIKQSYNHIKDKYGSEGYAKNKIYFEDEQYHKFLKEINNLLKDYESFKKEYIKIIK